MIDDENNMSHTNTQETPHRVSPSLPPLSTIFRENQGGLNSVKPCDVFSRNNCNNVNSILLTTRNPNVKLRMDHGSEKSSL